MEESVVGNNRINGQKTGKTCVCGPKPFESPQK